MTEERERPVEPVPAATSGRPVPPAPVVTEEGVFGTPPPPRMTLRDLERTRYRGSAPWLTVAVAAFAFAAAAWLAAFTAAQATGPAVALPVIERGLESMTGLRGLLVLQEPAVRLAAGTAPAPDTPVVVPGFEVRGAALTRAQVEAGGPAEWHAPLLHAAAEAVYRDGIEALALTPQATGGGWFTTPGAARLVMHALSDRNHGLASLLLWPAGLATVALGALVVYAGHSLGRLQALGVGLVLAAIPVGVVGLLGIGLVAFAGSDGSTLATTFSDMAAEVARAPVRNALTLGLAGLAIALPALVTRVVLERLQPDPATDGGVAGRGMAGRR